jgi:hypothetical protein
METVIFLIFVGVCAFVAVWVTRKSGKQKDLSRTRSEKLTPTTHDRLSRKEDIWEARRQFAQKNLSSVQKYVPKSAAAAEPEYDGYSRRDRHHLTTVGKVKKESHLEDSKKFSPREPKPEEHIPANR